MKEIVMRGSTTQVCVVTKSGKPRKVSRTRADEIVSQGGKFISRTRFKALTSGVKVPEKLFKKGDRAVKNYIEEQAKKTRKTDQEKNRQRVGTAVEGDRKSKTEQG